MKHFVVAAVLVMATSVIFADDLGYSPDGGLVSFGEFDYVYDSASRLTEVWSNGVQVVENQYDALGRRVVKRTPEATHTFVYDGWLLVVERIERGNGQLRTCPAPSTVQEESAAYCTSGRTATKSTFRSTTGTAT